MVLYKNLKKKFIVDERMKEMVELLLVRVNVMFFDSGNENSKQELNLGD